MLEEQKPTTGTPDPDDTDALETETGGTQGEDGRDAVDGDESENPLHLEWKKKAERTNEAEERAKRAEEEVERLRQERSGSPAPDFAGQQAELDDLEADRVELARLARAGDVTAKTGLRALDATIALRQDMLDYAMIQAVPEARRAQVLKTYEDDKKSGRNRFGSIADVNNAYEHRDLKKRNQELEAKLAELEKPKRNGDGTYKGTKDDIPRTASRESPAPPNAKKPQTMLKDDYDARKEELTALANDGDDNARRELHALQMKVRTRETILRR